MIGLLAFLLPLIFYLGIPSTLWNFDGIACAAAIELGWPTYFFHANHLLYGFFGFLFWKWACYPTGMARALPALQLFNSFLSAAGLLGVYRILEARLGDERKALLLTLSLAFTAAFWVWTIEAQVYPLGFAALAWATWVLLEDQSPAKYWKIGLLHGFAVLGHVLHLLWILPAVDWMRQDPAFKQKGWRSYLISLSAMILLPYAIVLKTVVARGHDWKHVQIWLKGSAGLTRDHRWAWHSIGWTGPWVWLKSTAPALWGSFWPYGRTVVTPPVWVLTGISVVLFLLLLVQGTRQASDKIGRFGWLWLLAYGLFLCTWEPGTLCYRMTDIIPLGLLLALGIKTLKIRAQIPVLGLFLACLLTVNLSSRILPMRAPEQNSAYQDVLALSKMSSPDSLYLTTGGLTWIYLLYFTGRTALNTQSFDPARLKEEVERQKKIRPVYVQNGSKWEQVR